MKVWLDGRVRDGEDARIPVTDHGLLYGDGVFEGIRVYSGRVFRLDRHLERLETSARAIALRLPFPTARIRAIVLETVRAFGAPDAYVRLLLTRGVGSLGVDPTTCPVPRLICIVANVSIYPEEKRARGLDLVTASVRRAPPDCLDPGVKSLNYLTNAMAKLEARQRGADEALLLNRAGAVAEAAVANLFCARRGVVRTPPASDGALEGVTRECVIELAGELGIPVEERTLGRVDLFGADEVFLTGTGAEIAPVRSLDSRPIGAVPGPLTTKLVAAFDESKHAHGTATEEAIGAAPGR